MDRLYTPWRYSFIAAEKSADCIFCAKVNADDRTSLVVHRGRSCYVCLNAFPYNNGHVMIVPNDHLDSLAALPLTTAHEMMDLAQLTERVVRATYDPAGINAGLNLGEAAGAGVAGHVHLHFVPRWSGDANFMTTIGETRVLPETLEQTWQRLTAAFEISTR